MDSRQYAELRAMISRLVAQLRREWAFSLLILPAITLACTSGGAPATSVPRAAMPSTPAAQDSPSPTPLPSDTGKRSATIEPSVPPLETLRDTRMEEWIGKLDIAIELAASITRSLEDIRPEFAECDFSRAVEFNSRYYDARQQLMDAVGGIKGPPGITADLTQLLLIALDLEIQADAIRSTSMQLAIAEGRTSNCDAGDVNAKDGAALEAKQLFVDLWNEIAPLYGGRSWKAEDF